LQVVATQAGVFQQ